MSGWADEEYYVYAGNPDEPIHTADHPFCDDETCPCHRDAENLGILQGWYDEGLIGNVDRELIYHGHTI